MLNRLKKLNKLGITSLVLMITITLAYGYSLISYAFYSKNVEQQAANDMISACFSLEFTEQTNSISLNNAYPTTKANAYASKSPYIFTITNKCSTDMYYNITLNTTGTSSLDNYLTYELDDSADNVLKTDIIGNLAKYDDYNNYTYTDENNHQYEIKDSYIIYNGFLAKAVMDSTNTNVVTPGETKQFKLYIWMNEDVTNEEAMNKDFIGKIIVTGSSSKLSPICKRATALHTDGTHTYGSLGTNGTLAAGDAFDCDVIGNGNYTERFYYVTDVDTNTAALVYYNNVSAGIADNLSTYKYDENGNVHADGPATAIAQLPTTSQWPNVKLMSSIRDITDHNGNIKKAGFEYRINGIDLAARLLTTQEINAACGITVGAFAVGELDGCIYLMENTKYQDSSLKYGYWLENAGGTNSTKAWDISGVDRYAILDTAAMTGYFGVRPVIEVDKQNIAY